MEQVSIRLEDEQIKSLDRLAAANGCTRSEQVRAGIDKYLGLCERVAEGNFIVSLPSIDADEIDLVTGDIDEAIDELKDSMGGEYLTKVLSIVKNALMFEAAIKLVEQKPDELVDLGAAYLTHDMQCDIAAMNYHDYKYHGKPYKGIE